MASFFSPSWNYLEQEGYLAQACLCNGLTALRNANLGDKKGNFYSAFFELSIGFERMLKLIFLLDYLAENDLALPAEGEVRKLGHELTTLFECAKNICQRRCPEVLSKFEDDELGVNLLKFLHQFAQSAGRYSNLNKLTGGRQRHIQDPLAQWADVVTVIIFKQASKQELERIQASEAIARQDLNDVALSLIGHLDQTSLDVGDLFRKAKELDIASKYAAFALVSLIENLREPLSHATHAAQIIDTSTNRFSAAIPHMDEFFQFAWADKRHTLNKRRWP